MTSTSKGSSKKSSSTKRSSKKNSKKSPTKKSPAKRGARRPEPPIQKIVVRDSELHGLGVFATVDIEEGEIIELCPYLVIDDDDIAEDNRLNDYLFSSPDEEGDYLVILGSAMMYNHDDKPNAEWEIDDDDNRFVRFTALRAISVGEEITQDYGREYWETRSEE